MVDWPEVIHSENVDCKYEVEKDYEGETEEESGEYWARLYVAGCVIREEFFYADDDIDAVEKGWDVLL